MWIAWMMLGCWEGKPTPVIELQDVLDGSESLNSLDEDQRSKLCGVYAIQEPVVLSCAVIDVAVEPLEEQACLDHWVPQTCPATVLDWWQCQDAIREDPCAIIERHSACRPLEACGVHLWSAALGLDGSVPLDDLAGDEVRATCDAGNRFEGVDVSCIDFLDPLPFDPDVAGCQNEIDNGLCGTISDYLDCQLELLKEVEDAVCRLEFPEVCGKLSCL